MTTRPFASSLLLFPSSLPLPLVFLLLVSFFRLSHFLSFLVFFLLDSVSFRFAGTAGPYTNEAGFLAYYEILSLLSTGGGQSAYDPTAHGMYAWSGNQWVCYDDVNTLKEKVDYLLGKGLGGGMVWCLDLDDFPNGYPLISSIAQVCLLFFFFANTLYHAAMHDLSFFVSFCLPLQHLLG